MKWRATALDGLGVLACGVAMVSCGASSKHDGLQGMRAAFLDAQYAEIERLAGAGGRDQMFTIHVDQFGDRMRVTHRSVDRQGRLVCRVHCYGNDEQPDCDSRGTLVYVVEDASMIAFYRTLIDAIARLHDSPTGGGGPYVHLQVCWDEGRFVRVSRTFESAEAMAFAAHLAGEDTSSTDLSPEFNASHTMLDGEIRLFDHVARVCNMGSGRSESSLRE